MPRSLGLLSHASGDGPVGNRREAPADHPRHRESDDAAAAAAAARVRVVRARVRDQRAAACRTTRAIAATRISTGRTSCGMSSRPMSSPSSRDAGVFRSRAASSIAATSIKSVPNATHASLRFRGNDTSVGGVAAYSTLGHFDDPILNTMLGWNDVQLAGTLFHELAHQVVYVPGESEFNEAFATVVEEAGLERWLTTRDRVQDMRAWYTQRERGEQFIGLLLVDARTLAQSLRREAARGRAARSQASGVRPPRNSNTRNSRHEVERLRGLRPLVRSRAEQRASRLGRDVSRLPAEVSRAAEIARS